MRGGCHRCRAHPWARPAASGGPRVVACGAGRARTPVAGEPGRDWLDDVTDRVDARLDDGRTTDGLVGHGHDGRAGSGPSRIGVGARRRRRATVRSATPAAEAPAPEAPDPPVPRVWERSRSRPPPMPPAACDEPVGAPSRAAAGAPEGAGV